MSSTSFIVKLFTTAPRRAFKVTRPSTSSRSNACRTGVRLSPISCARPASVITAPAG
jgi:hypothetical protein